MGSPGQHDDMTIQDIARQLLAHARAHQLMPQLTDRALVAACACALNRAHELDWADTGRFALESRFFGMAQAQAWERHRVCVLCVDDQVMHANGAVGWDQILASQELTQEEKDQPAGMPIQRQWLGEPFAREAGAEACRDLGNRAQPMLELAKELQAMVASWNMDQGTNNADEPVPKPRRM